MCLPLDFWLCCMSRTVDDDPAPASRTRNGGGSHYTSNGNAGHHHYNGNGYHATAAEAYRKAASNDVRRGPAAHHAGAVAPAAATRGWHDHHTPATAAQEKIAVAAYPYAGAEETLKQQPLPAAWNGRVAAANGGHGARGGAPHNYYYERAQLPAQREDAVDSHYTAATATADHERC